jgi:hypothetical protein
MGVIWTVFQLDEQMNSWLDEIGVSWRAYIDSRSGVDSGEWTILNITEQSADYLFKNIFYT